MVKWEGFPPEEATREDIKDLEDKVAADGEEDDTITKNDPFININKNYGLERQVKLSRSPRVDQPVILRRSPIGTHKSQVGCKITNCKRIWLSIRSLNILKL